MSSSNLMVEAPPLPSGMRFVVKAAVDGDVKVVLERKRKWVGWEVVSHYWCTSYRHNPVTPERVRTAMFFLIDSHARQRQRRAALESLTGIYPPRKVIGPATPKD